LADLTATDYHRGTEVAEEETAEYEDEAEDEDD